MSAWGAGASIRQRLLVGTLVAVSLSLLIAGFVLSRFFHEHATRQFEQSLTVQLDQLTSALQFVGQDEASIALPTGAEPRWERPYSGLYWQLDRVKGANPPETVARSRSLWDTKLEWSDSTLKDGMVHSHTIVGPNGIALYLIERTVRSADSPNAAWRLVVAADMAPIVQAGAEFNRILVYLLLTLLVLLLLAALAQVLVSLSPLRTLAQALQNLDEGKETLVRGKFPKEVQPMVNRLNKVMERNAEVLVQARTQAGNLAHALKTPLAVLEQAADKAVRESPGEFASLVQSQVRATQQQVEWQLARARASSLQALPGQRTAVQASAAAMLRVMGKVHAQRVLMMSLEMADASLEFAGAEQDFQELIGNLLDNACKWANRSVWFSASSQLSAGRQELCIQIEDDGPGIAPEQIEQVMTRGVRLDETVPGSGLGLGIVSELCTSQGGRLELGKSKNGGLCARLYLPLAPPRN